MNKAEFYHQNPNLIAVDEYRRFVAFCLHRLDPLPSIAEMEAQGVHSDSRNLTLETALLSEGQRRVVRHQPNLICVVEIDVSDPMNQFLESAGFVRTVTINLWGKIVD